MKLTGYVYDSEEVDNQPDLNEFMFRFPDGTNAYVKVGHNVIAHTKGEHIEIDGGRYVVGETHYSYSRMESTGDYELSFVAVDLEEVK